MSLKYEPSSELLHLSAKQLILNCNVRHTSVSLRLAAILRALLAILRASCKGVLAILTATGDIRLPGKENSNSRGARPVYSLR